MFKKKDLPEVTDRDIKMAQQLSREDYKAIKHMKKEELVAYLRRIWQRGYNAGHSVGLREGQEIQEKASKPAEKEAE